MALCGVKAPLLQVAVILLYLLTQVSGGPRRRIFHKLSGRRRLFFPLQLPETECCVRDSKRIIAGFDARRLPVYLDVGHCKKICGHRRHGSKSRNKGSNSCTRHTICTATRTKVEKLFLHGGMFEYDVIESCHCTTRPRRCQRKPKRMLYFPDTPYRREVDIGQCMGNCRNNRYQCNAVRNKTISIKGPNGATCVTIVADCQCGPTCFKAQKRQIYYETYINNTTSEVVKRLKEINVGECVGTCGVKIKGTKCVFASSSNPHECLMSLVKRPEICMPIAYTEHKFTTLNLKRKTVLAIDKCGCK